MNKFLFEAENEEKRNRDGRNKNVIKFRDTIYSGETFQVGSPDLNDPYSGKPIYVLPETDDSDETDEMLEINDSDYNASTGSYSGLYGKKAMNQEETDAFADIMGSNSSYKKSIDDIIKENS